jgi:DNA-binding transcriptional ArsR family regulator
MSTRHYSWAWRQPVTGLARYVLLALVERSDQSGACWPSVATLAKQTGLGERTVRAKLTELEAGGAIERERRHRKDGTRTSDRIVLVYADIGLAAGDAVSPAAGDAARQPPAADSVPTPGMTSSSSGRDKRQEMPRKIPPVDPTREVQDPNTEDQDLVLDVEKRPNIRGGHSARIIADLERRRRRAGAELDTDAAIGAATRKAAGWLALGQERTDEEPP